VKIPSTNILKDFVDRVQELDGFEKMVGNLAKRVMCIYGPGGIGKSILLSKMMEECEKRGMRWNYTEWRDSKHYGYLDLMRKIRNETSPSLFLLFNDRVNFYMEPQYDLKIQLEGGAIQNVKVLEGGEIQQSGVTIHVGHKVVITDSEINIPRPDRNVTDDEMMIELTCAFMPCLQATVRESPLVIFLDALEKADEPTKSWIRDEFLVPIRDEEISNLIVVLASREEIELDPSFFDCTDKYELRPFQTAHIQEYLSRRGVEPNETLIDFIFATTKGNPIEIATNTNSLLQLRQKRQREANA